VRETCGFIASEVYVLSGLSASLSVASTASSPDALICHKCHMNATNNSGAAQGVHKNEQLDEAQRRRLASVEYVLSRALTRLHLKAARALVGSLHSVLLSVRALVCSF
jgi:hypothetical protein